jgi:hypothetical protein
MTAIGCSSWWFTAKGYNARNPVSAVGLFREENTRSRWLTEDEERALFKGSQPHIGPCAVWLFTQAAGSRSCSQPGET